MKLPHIHNAVVPERKFRHDLLSPIHDPECEIPRLITAYPMEAEDD